MQLDSQPIYHVALVLHPHLCMTAAAASWHVGTGGSATESFPTVLCCLSFTVDHVKDMDMDSRPKRLLRGVADARTSIESLWAMQDTAEAIEAIGAKGTKLGSLQAGAASGHRGNTAMSQKMLDTITHQEAVDNKGGGRPRRLKAIV